MQDGYEIASLIISTGLRPDGMFTFSDYVALGALRALREQGVHIPRDVAVVGYDDIDFASYLTAPLSTVRIPKEVLGRTALELLDKRIHRQIEETEVFMKLDVELVVRQSSFRQ